MPKTKNRLKIQKDAVDSAYLNATDPLTDTDLWNALSKMASSLAQIRFNEQSEDASQDGLAEIFDSLKKGLYAKQDGAKFSTWAGAVIERACIERYSKETATRTGQLPIENLPKSSQKKLIADKGLKVEHQERVTAIKQAVKTLGKYSKRRQKITELALQGYTHAEIAKQLDTTEKAISHQWEQALRELKQ